MWVHVCGRYALPHPVFILSLEDNLHNFSSSNHEGSRNQAQLSGFTTSTFTLWAFLLVLKCYYVTHLVPLRWWQHWEVIESLVIQRSLWIPGVVPSRVKLRPWILLLVFHLGMKWIALLHLTVPAGTYSITTSWNKPEACKPAVVFWNLWDILPTHVEYCTHVEKAY